MADDHTTVIETPSRGGSGAGWVIAVILIVALVVGVVLLTRNSGSDAAKDNAIANAANQVGNAAEKAGNAAQDAVNQPK
ncbi:MAG: hypothetical protein ACTHLU_06420 [Novosphingobium sp.]